jgi:sarcosine oxidase
VAKRFDAAVIGLGAMGAATLEALASRGLGVVGIDQYTPPHDLGSTHGETRVTRLAVGEGDEYVPLVRRSHERWRDLEAECGETLLEQCGFLTIDTTGGESCVHGMDGFFERTVAIAERHGITHELLDARGVRRRFPAFVTPDETRGYFEPEGGFVHVERAVAALMKSAARQGAELRLGCRYLGHRRAGDAFSIETSSGRVDAGALVIAAGPWLPGIAPSALSSVRLYRQALHWFTARPNARVGAADLPVFLWLHGSGAEDFFYGFPDIGGGIKMATEQYRESAADPDCAERTVCPQEVAAFQRRHLEGRIAPSLEHSRSVTCLYSVSPDAHFIIDRLAPDDPAIIISACSGHGFKHAPAVGELVATAIMDGAALPSAFSRTRAALQV